MRTALSRIRIPALLCSAVVLLAATPHARSPHAVRLSVYARTYQASLRLNDNLTAGANSIAILHADYRANDRWSAGASYQYTSFNGFAPQNSLSKLLESYVTFEQRNVLVRAGNQMFGSPWADAHNVSGLPPSSFQGIVGSYARNAWSFDAAVMDRFEDSAATSFSRTTLLTSLTPGATTSGFMHLHAGYASKDGRSIANAYVYGLSGLGTMAWFAGTRVLSSRGWAPQLDVQAGVEHGSSQSYTGKVQSEITGAQLSAMPIRNIKASVAFDAVPWRTDTIRLSAGVSCNSSGSQPTFALSTPSARGYYFLPSGAAQCRTTGTRTTVYYGGWASPYSDSHASDPLYTTGAAEGLVDRRSPGSSGNATLTYYGDQGRLKLTSSYSWFNYSNPIAMQNTEEWDNIVKFYASDVHRAPYRGLLVMYLYVQLHKSNAAYPSGAPFLGGTAQGRYSRIQFEYAM